MNEWVSADERKPKEGHYLVTDGHMVMSAMKTENGWLIPPFMKGVSYWMELPPPPPGHSNLGTKKKKKA